MNLLIFDEKAVSEVIPLTVNFSDRLLFGEVVTGATVSATVFTGTDPTPSAILSGAPTFTGTSITQLITGGLPGVIYSLVFIAAGSATHAYIKVGRLSVMPNDNQY